MGRPPKKSTIAAALGVSPAAFSRYQRNGCPATSIEAAKRWQASRVDPAQRTAAKYQQKRPKRREPDMELFERVFLDGKQTGRRSALDWCIEHQALGAAALIKHAGMAPEDAVNAAGFVIHTLHAVARYELSVDDADINAIFEKKCCSFPALVKSLDKHEPPEAMVARAVKIAEAM